MSGLTLDVFNEDAFSAISLTAAVDRYGYVPTALQKIPGLVVPVPVQTTRIFIEERNNAPTIIPVTPRGAPPTREPASPDLRDARSFGTVRFAKAARITAEQLQNMRAFGSTSLMQTLQMQIGRDGLRIKRDFAVTKERMLLALIQGLAIEPASGRTIYNWFTEFDQEAPAAVAFNFAGHPNNDGAIRGFCNGIIRTITRNLKGLGGDEFEIVALCGDGFWDAFTTCAEVKATYLNWTAAADLRNDVGKPWSAFRFGNINWQNYRGTDDNATVAIPNNTAIFFPIKAGIFQWAMAPAERFEFVNTPGVDLYSWVVMDKDRNSWADIEYMSYPLPVCVQPSALMSGTQ